MHKLWRENSAYPVTALPTAGVYYKICSGFVMYGRQESIVYVRPLHRHLTQLRDKVEALRLRYARIYIDFNNVTVGINGFNPAVGTFYYKILLIDQRLYSITSNSICTTFKKYFVKPLAYVKGVS